MADDQHDAFICHASEDKDAVARPVALELIDRGFDVWFDEFTLELGDSLLEEVDRGLATSRFGVVILSRAFFAKRWPQRELDGLVALETSDGAKRILPIWHQVSAEDVRGFSPTLAGRLAASTEGGVDAIADQIERVLRPAASTERPRGEDVLEKTEARADGGEAPVEVNAEVIALLRRGDRVGLRTRLKGNRAKLGRDIQQVIAERRQHRPSADQLESLYEQIVPSVQSYLAGLLPHITCPRKALRSPLGGAQLSDPSETQGINGKRSRGLGDLFPPSPSDRPGLAGPPGIGEPCRRRRHAQS